jgi:hypothetical protein
MYITHKGNGNDRLYVSQYYWYKSCWGNDISGSSTLLVTSTNVNNGWNHIALAFDPDDRKFGISLNQNYQFFYHSKDFDWDDNPYFMSVNYGTGGAYTLVREFRVWNTDPSDLQDFLDRYTGISFEDEDPNDLPSELFQYYWLDSTGDHDIRSTVGENKKLN